MRQTGYKKLAYPIVGVILAVDIAVGLTLPAKSEDIPIEVEAITITQNTSSQEAAPSTTETQPPSGEATPSTTETQPPTTQPKPPTTVTPPPQDEPKVVVAEVVVEGATPELKELVYKTITTQPGRTTNRSQLQEDLNRVYATGFFADVRVAPEDTPLGVRIIFSVLVNPVLQEVTVEAIPTTDKDRVLPKEVIDSIFGSRYGKILNLRELQEDIKKVNQWYKDKGYDLAQVVGAPKISRSGEVTLIVAEGIIEDIKVRFFNQEDEPTNGNTRDFIITREIQLKPGDVFNRNIAQKDLQRVYGLGIFEDVKLSFSPGEDPSKVVINVDVVESSTGSLAAGAGISSASGFFGQISYQQQNLGGNNQTLGTELQIGTREILFDVNFTDPWIAGDPYRTSYTINGFRRQSISLVYDGDNNEIRTDNGDDRPRVVRTGGGIVFSRPLAADPFSKPDWRLSAGFEYQRVSIQNADGDVAARSSEDDGFQKLAYSSGGEDDLVFLKFGASSDNRNDPLQPTSGSLLRLGMEQTVPVGLGSIFFNRIRASYSYYIPVKYINFDFSEGPQAFAFNLQAGTVFGDIPPYEAFVIGGSNSVRGYPEGEVGSGKSYLQATAEYRFPVFSVVGGTLFFDFGTNFGTGSEVPGDPSGVRDLPGSGYGYGVGVRVQSPLGPIRVDYGINDQGDNRIHFGIGERF